MSTQVLWQGSLVPIEDDKSWSGQPFAIPIPNATLRDTSSISDLGPFLAIGEAWADLVTHFSPEAPFFLDVGCGCGKLARFLHINPKLRYIGIDLFLPSIEWCRKAFEPITGARFRFEHFNGYSESYNPTGDVDPATYQFPPETNSVDTVVCASLFTHLCVRFFVHPPK